MTRARFILASLVVLAACTDGPPPTTPASPTPPTPLLHVSGRMLDFASSQGLAGIESRWIGITGNQALPSVSATSDASGAFRVDLPVAEQFQVQFAIDLNTSALVIVPGKQLDTNLLVNAGQCAARYGTVIDAVTRQPIAGARVTRAGTAETDAAGRYRIDIGCERRTDWGTGTTTISVQHPGYQGAFVFDGRREGTSFSGIRRVDFAMQPLASASGLIFNQREGFSMRMALSASLPVGSSALPVGKPFNFSK